MKNSIIIILMVCCLTIKGYTQKSFLETTEETKLICNDYIKNYSSLNFDQLANYMHDSISFQDPTAKLVFAGKLIEGKENLLLFFKTGYSSIVDFNLDITNRIISSSTAMYEIDLTWSFNNQNSKLITIKNMPLRVLLTVKNGKVIQHRDYGDYVIFLKQYQEQNQ